MMVAAVATAVMMMVVSVAATIAVAASRVTASAAGPAATRPATAQGAAAAISGEQCAGGTDGATGTCAKTVIGGDRCDGDTGQQKGIFGHRLPFAFPKPRTNPSKFKHQDAPATLCDLSKSHYAAYTTLYCLSTS